MSANSPTPTLLASSIIFFFHSISGFPSPTSHSLVKMACDIGHRTLSSSQNKKKPILFLTMRSIILCFASSTCSLLDLMRVYLDTLCFSRFLTGIEVINLKWQDILFIASHMNLLLKKSKIDQYSKGLRVLIAHFIFYFFFFWQLYCMSKRKEKEYYILFQKNIFIKKVFT